MLREVTDFRKITLGNKGRWIGGKEYRESNVIICSYVSFDTFVGKSLSLSYGVVYVVNKNLRRNREEFNLFPLNVLTANQDLVKRNLKF